MTKNREVKATDSGRTVFGGGGITPDDKIDTPKSIPVQDELLEHYAFFNFAKHYMANRTVGKDFQVDDAVMDAFKQFLTSQQIPYTDADLTPGDGLGQGQHQGRDFHHPVWPGRGLEGAGQLGSHDQQGARLPAPGKSPGERRQARGNPACQCAGKPVVRLLSSSGSTEESVRAGRGYPQALNAYATSQWRKGTAMRHLCVEDIPSGNREGCCHSGS